MAGTQPIWLLGCPIEGHFIVKNAPLAFSTVGVLLIEGLLSSEPFLTSVNFFEVSLSESNEDGSGLIIFLKILLKSKSDTARVLLHMPKYIAPNMTDWQVMLQTRNTKMTAITFFVIKS